MKPTLFSLLLFYNFTTVAQYIDGGNGHAIILDKNGHVWTMGRNNFGQLGDSSLNNSAMPKRVEQLKDIVAVSRGYDHSIALNNKGELFLWGRNNYGRLGSALVADIHVPNKIPGNNYAAVEGGHWHTVALKKDGSVWAWGHNFYGELGNGSWEHSAWPVAVQEKINNECVPLAGVKQIASVGYFTLALKEDGSVCSWGTNDWNELGYESDLIQPYARKIKNIPPMQQVAVGWHHAVGLDVNGNIWIWGSDPAYQVRESCSKKYDRPTKLNGLPKFTKIACGSWHSLAIDENKQVWACGKNHYGMCGTGDSISHSLPLKISSLENIVDVGGGCFESIAVNESGKIFAFGDNPSGQLGNGKTGRCYFPTPMNLDMDGNLNPSTEMKIIAEKMVNAEHATVKSIIKYSLFVLSILLNILLFLRLHRLKPRLAV